MSRGVSDNSRGESSALASSLATVRSCILLRSVFASIFHLHPSVSHQKTRDIIIPGLLLHLLSMAVQLTLSDNGPCAPGTMQRPSATDRTDTFDADPASVLLEHQPVGCMSSPKLGKSQCDGPMEKLSLTLGHYA